MGCRYGDGSLRFTVEQNIVFPNIPEGRLDEMQQEAIFKVHQIEAPPLSRGLVSCTGAQFCGIALIETKNRSPPLPPPPASTSHCPHERPHSAPVPISTSSHQYEFPRKEI